VTAIYWPDFPTFTYYILFAALSEGDPVELSISIWYGKTRMAGLQAGEGRMMID